MNYIVESLLVVIYTSLVYLLFLIFINKKYILLFTIGFTKHFLGNYFGLHKYYYNYNYKYLYKIK